MADRAHLVPTSTGTRHRVLATTLLAAIVLATAPSPADARTAVAGHADAAAVATASPWAPRRTPILATPAPRRAPDPTHAPQVRRIVAPRPAPTVARAPAASTPKPAAAPRVRRDTGDGTVALTFDDGPSPTWTPQVLDLLERHGARATFFLVGSQVAAHPDLARAIVARGHRVAGHTMDHVDLVGLAPDRWEQQVDRANDLVARTTGQAVSCLRPPYGSHDAGVDRRLADRGLDVAMWTIDPLDWTRPGADVIARRTLDGLRPGAVVLLHDGGGDRSQTVAALEQVLAVGTARGLTFRPQC